MNRPRAKMIKNGSHTSFSMHCLSPTKPPRLLHCLSAVRTLIPTKLQELKWTIYCISPLPSSVHWFKRQTILRGAEAKIFVFDLSPLLEACLCLQSVCGIDHSFVVCWKALMLLRTRTYSCETFSNLVHFLEVLIEATIAMVMQIT